MTRLSSEALRAGEATSGVPCYVGLDTSNYTTSAAVCVREADGHFRVLANLKGPLSVAEGARGLRQSEAVFAHVRGLPELLSRLSESLKGYSIRAVGYSDRPRQAEDSYMPCFLVGKAAAQALCVGAAVPAYAFSHQSGHIMAALYSAGVAHELWWRREPFLAFHVSGGTTEAVAVHSAEHGFGTEILGGTMDLHAGQVIDRVGVHMGLSFPCGPAMERLAQNYEGSIPTMRASVRDGWCNLSGVENRAVQLYDATGDSGLVSAFVFHVLADVLCLMTQQIQARAASPRRVVYAGGVMSNRLLRHKLTAQGRFPVYVAEPAFSADNAAGVALLAAIASMSSGVNQS